MVIDHSGEFFPNSPDWFRFIGRAATPLFFFASAWGFYYTHDRKSYLLRLYIMSVIMTIGNACIYNLCSSKQKIFNNVFPTLFIGCLVIYIFEKYRDRKTRFRYLILIGIWQFGTAFLTMSICSYSFITNFLPLKMDTQSFGAIFGNVFFTEGGFLFVLFFIGTYILKDSPCVLSLFLYLFSLGCMYISRVANPAPGMTLFNFDTYQWMMVFAMPVYALYNRKPGPKIKWFFYLFYPLHIWMLYICASFI